jgi:hypothetical protein
MYGVLRQLLPESTTTSPGRSWVARPGVEALDPAKVIGEIRTGRRVHVHQRRDARHHRLLDQGGVEVPRIESDEPHRRSTGGLGPSCERKAADGQHEQDDPNRSHPGLSSPSGTA